MDAQSILVIAATALLSGGGVWLITKRQAQQSDGSLSVPERTSRGQVVTPNSADSVSPDLLSGERTSGAPNSPASVIIQNSHGEMAMALTEVPTDLFDRISGTRLKAPKAIGRLNALLQAAPATALAIQGVPKNVWEVAINGPLLNAKDSSGNIIQGMYRAMTNGGSGGIKEHALLTRPEGLANAMNAAAVWQIASVVVAQKHLADISEKLESLATSVDRVEGKLDAQRRGTILGAISVLREVAKPILSGEHTPTNRQTLDTHYQEVTKTNLALDEILAARIAALPSIKDTQMVGAGDYADKIRSEMEAICVLFQEKLLCSRARYQAWALLTALPGEPILKAERFGNIQRDLEKLSALDGIRGQFAENITSMIMRVHARMSGQETLATLRLDLNKDLNRRLSDLERDFNAEKSLLVKGESLLTDATHPTRLLVKTQGDQVVEYIQLPATEAPQLLEHDMQPSIIPAHLLQREQVAASMYSRGG